MADRDRTVVAGVGAVARQEEVGTVDRGECPVDISWWACIQSSTVALRGPGLGLRVYAAASWARRQRMPASMKSSISPSSTAWVLPVSNSVRRSLTIWYGLST